MAERGDDISGDRPDGKTAQTVKVYHGGLELSLHVVLDAEGDIDTDETEVISAVLVDIDDRLEAKIYEEVQR